MKDVTRTAERGFVVSAFRSEFHEVFAIETDAVVMNVIGVFLWNLTVETGRDLAHVLAIASVGGEDDKPLSLLVDLGILHLAHPVVTLSQLGEFSLLAVVEVEVCVSVAVTLPENMVFVEITTVVA